MFLHLFTLYRKHRIVNINVNIIVASLVSIALTALVMMYVPLRDELSVIIATAVINGIIDLIVYVLLHWWSNKYHHVAQTKKSFAKDVWKVEVQRYVIAPVFYGVSIISQTTLLRADVGIATSVVVAYTLGLVATRTIHTLWGLRTGLFH